MKHTIQIRTMHISTFAAERDVAEVYSQDINDLRNAREITPETAVTIASWWQSPGNIGNVLASFASGAEVDRTALLDDIDATRRTESFLSDEDRAALDCLATFVINYGMEDEL